ncbi:spore germination protein [Clostridium tyrobutyricum]|uniref:GerAB/ArcD/ProY family transporter n=1 Tax=Clostridium tyrobutyricum TaxID=1519 RepID=UPI001C39170D|nr:GerAB/ArcD/ProY family transporter [Clostridium tyrobutyricum]MBV4419191.1 spore germination protein [Clostridium tyrobutyricum]
MIREGNMGLFETLSIIMILITNKMCYSSTSILIYKVGTAAWYGTIISCIISILFFLVICSFMKKFPGHNLLSIFEIVLGKFFGKIVSLIFSIYFLLYSAYNLREFVDMLQSYVFPKAPNTILIISILITAVIIIHFGLECIGRISLTIILPVVLGLICMFLLAYPNYYFGNIYPFWGYGIFNTLKFGFLRSSAYSEVIAVLFMINSIHGLKEAKKAGIISLIFAGTLVSISTICHLMAFNYLEGGENISGIYELLRIIYINRFVERVESIFLLIIIIPTIMNITISMYISISTYCHVFTIKNINPLVIPFTILCFICAIFPKNFAELLENYLIFIKQYSLILNYLIPIFIFIISVVFRRGEKKSNA